MEYSNEIDSTIGDGKKYGPYHLMDWMDDNKTLLDSFEALEDLRAAYERIGPVDQRSTVEPCYYEEIEWDNNGNATAYEKYGIYE